MSELAWIFVSALLVNNFTLSYFLGLCPFFGVSSRLDTAFRLGLANVFVLVITSLAAWALETFVLPCSRPAAATASSRAWSSPSAPASA